MRGGGAQWLCLPVVIGGVVFSCLKPNAAGSYTIEFDMTALTMASLANMCARRVDARALLRGSACQPAMLSAAAARSTRAVAGSPRSRAPRTRS